MITLLLGGGGSGKSALAESMIVENGCHNRYYLATMATSDPESLRRIHRHRKMREGKGFCTIECPIKLEDIILPEKGDILLECMSNLVANELFEPGGRREQTADRIMDGILSLERQANHLFIVSNNVFEDGLIYPGDTENYLRILADVNCRIAERASLVIESVQGIPVIWKNEGLDFAAVAKKRDMTKSDERNYIHRAFITGGSFQHKLEWAKKYWQELHGGDLLPDEAIWDGEKGLPESWQGITIVNRLHQLVRYMLENGREPKELVSILSNQDNLIIITDEVGCGLVPLTEFERNWRDASGRVSCELAAMSQDVFRVTSGLAQKIR